METEADPNDIHQDAVPRLRITPLAPAHSSLKFNDIGAHALKTRGATVLTVRVADHLACVPFLVAERLSTDMILGYNYMDKNVDAIHPTKSI